MTNNQLTEIIAKLQKVLAVARFEACALDDEEIGPVYSYVICDIAKPLSWIIEDLKKLSPFHDEWSNEFGDNLKT